MRDHGCRPVVVAFYLPQFHQIPENDLWWGTGFTDWVNVRKAVPQFEGHGQPLSPHAVLGEYDLTDPKVLVRQFALASEHGVDAFCFYHYWFDGRRLLEAPLDTFLESDADGRFAICWANENWTRRWDGKAHEVLMRQEFSEGYAERVFSSFLPYLRDGRYLRVDNKTPIVVHRVDKLPDAEELAASWRALARRHGVGELLLIASETVRDLDPRSYGFDAVAEFPPVGSNDLRSALPAPPRGLHHAFHGRLMSYERLARSRERRYARATAFVRYSGVAPGWDNSARRGIEATIYVGSTAERYGRWLRRALVRESTRDDTGIVFINAWNEWAEGAILEPSVRDGFDYLRATRDAVNGGHETSPRPNEPPRELSSRSRSSWRPWIRSLTLATLASGLNYGRRVRAYARARVRTAAQSLGCRQGP